MKNNIVILTIFFQCLSFSVMAQKTGSESLYTVKPEDSGAVYFTPGNFAITADGKTDVSDALQGAINKLKLEQNLGILFIPEGIYTISKTIYIPAAIRLIGYGKKRPLFVLKKNSPGFQQPVETDKGKASYMFWFTGSVVESTDRINDASAGTFYSALSNIDLKIEDGNPQAVALRTHYAQHSFVSYCDIQIGNGKAGMFDVGNYMEHVRFFGGDYGIYTTKTSPGWQFMMIDNEFEGQRIAAIKTQEAGLTIVRMTVRNAPSVIEVNPNFWEKLYMEDCRFINIKKPAISLDNEENAHTQVNLRNIYCQNVPVLVNFQKSNRQTKAPGTMYQVKEFIYGLEMEDLDKAPQITTTLNQAEINKMPELQMNIPVLPSAESWVNLKSLGAKGDGETDDTKVMQDAIEKHPVIYVPQGLYRISETLKLKPNTILIGLHPMSTQFMLEESTENFSGFGSPVPMIEAPQGGSCIISGIGLSTGEYNYRAVACKWMAGEKSMISDVKFVGGHGSIRKGPFTPWRGNSNQGRKPAPIPGPEPSWDTQYWSLWVTSGGGGVFKNIWTASTFATSAAYFSNTKTPAFVYAMSVEHHVRNEVRFSNVSNWKIYALQLEEESRESQSCQPLEISNCRDMMFANLYMFRVIRFKTPSPYSVRTWNSRNVDFLNIHNYSQIKYTTDNPLYDINTGIEVRPQEIARLHISGDVPVNFVKNGSDSVIKLAEGFEFAEGMCSDSKGNVYFSEQRLKRIYKWSAETHAVTLLADYPWEPLSLACDTKDNLLVVFRYQPQYGRRVNGVQEQFPNPPDASGTSYSGWGNSGWATLVFSIDPNHPDETISLLKKVPMNSVSRVEKTLYPSNRWRDSHDFNQISVAKNEKSFVAPDGVTIIPDSYDLTRASALVEAFPGKPLYASDEYDKRTVRMDVDAQGYLSGLTYFAQKGEFSTIPGNKGNVYVADGDIYVYDNDGKPAGFIRVPERPSTLTFGGKNKDMLFVTGRKGLYAVKEK